MLRKLRSPVVADADHSVPLLKDESSNGSTCPSTTVSIQPCSRQCHTEPVLSSIFDDAHPTEYQGGRGVSTILSSRDKPPRYLGLPDRYWTTTIFTLQGRPAPILPLVFYTIYCVAAVAATLQFLASKHRGGGKPDTTYKEDMQFLQALQFPVAAIGTALFLLLAFRTNSCYDRWWEGRKLLDGISSKSVDLSRMVRAYIAPLNRQLAQQWLSWVIVTAHAIKWTLRREKVLEDVDHLLEPTDREELEAARFPVQLCTDKLSDLVFGLKSCPGISQNLVALMDSNIRGLLINASACARIVTTPLPFAYIVHLRSFMILWLAAVPWVLIPNLGYHSIIVSCIIGHQLFGFEEIGVEIENPFGHDYNDLPVDAIIRDLQAIVEDCKARVDAAASVAAAAAAAAATAATAAEQTAASTKDGEGEAVASGGAVAAASSCGDTTAAPTGLAAGRSTAAGGSGGESGTAACG